MIKKLFYTLFLISLLGNVHAIEKTKEEKVAKFVLENMQKDYISCYIFYKIATESFKKAKAKKSTIKGLNESADVTLKFAHDLGEILGLTPKIMAEKNKKEIKNLSKIAKKDFNKLTQVYGLMCKNLVENQKQRISYWENEGNKKIK